jgi:4-diphosphocytidyl-2-C-methyl-D-erythritol kinase
MNLSPAKINLGLKIINKRPDGYHNLESIFIRIKWGDFISFSPSNSFELLTSNHLQNKSWLEFEKVSERGNQEKNILFKAYRFCTELNPEIKGIKINLTKYIPTGGGLGGGSSNAAELIKFLVPKQTIIENLQMISKLGADIPFFLNNSSSFVQGIGEILFPLEVSEGFGVLVVPDIHIPTSDAFTELKKPLQETSFLKSCKSIESTISHQLSNGLWNDLSKNLRNDFESFAIRKFPELGILKEELIKHQFSFVSMSGSGSTFFGLSNNPKIVSDSLNELKSKFPNYQIISFNF